MGAGFVGSAFVGLLRDPSRQVALIDAATAPLELVGVVVRDPQRSRPGVPAELLFSSVDELFAKSPDILVEVAGGVDAMRPIVERALAAGVSVVTANKALMAQCGTALARLAHENGADLFYEASVGGGIPILRALRSSLAGERIQRVMGIVNGTTNFMLSKMTADGLDYGDVLAEAQALGFAEADPTADVEGFDATAKVLILSSLAFGTAMDGSDISRVGITGVRDIDVEFARRSGYVIKLIGVAERIGDHGLARRVAPALVPASHPLASVNGPMNAVFVEGVHSGPLVWSGQGAGGAPTATAVLGDVLDAARNKVAGRHDVPFSVDSSLSMIPAGDVRSHFYISIDVLDRPGVLAQVATVFGDNNVSIQSMEQSGFGDEARLSFLTHAATTSDVEATLVSLAALDAVDKIGNCLRVIEGAN